MKVAGERWEIVPPPGAGRLFTEERVAALADAGAAGRVRLDALARWLQDAAYNDLVDAGLAGRGGWVVRRLRMRVERFPRFGEAATVHTFCSAMAPLLAERRTTVKVGGTAVVEAVAVWVHLDPETLRPARLGEEFAAVYAESAAGRRARSRLRHPAPPATGETLRWTFRVADIDPAGHVNNAAYWEPVEELYADAEPEDADVEVEFREPAQRGEVTIVRDGSMLWVAGNDGALHASIDGVRSSG